MTTTTPKPTTTTFDPIYDGKGRVDLFAFYFCHNIMGYVCGWDDSLVIFLRRLALQNCHWVSDPVILR